MWILTDKQMQQKIDQLLTDTTKDITNLKLRVGNLEHSLLGIGRKLDCTLGKHEWESWGRTKVQCKHCGVGRLVGEEIKW